MSYTNDMREHDRHYASLCVTRTLEDIDTHGLRLTHATDIYLDFIADSKLPYDTALCKAKYLVLLGDKLTQRRQG